MTSNQPKADALLFSASLSIRVANADNSDSKRDESEVPLLSELLNDVAFEVMPRAIVAVTGPSGVGKSTFLRALARLHAHTTGTLLFRGTDASKMFAPNYRRQVHYLPQKAELGRGTARDAIQLPFTFASAAGAEAPNDDVIKALFDEVKLSPRMLDQEVVHLSVGEQQRVAFVRALLLEPVVLLLDEPTSALDKESRLAVEACIQRFGNGEGDDDKRLEKREDRAVLLVSHDEHQVERLSTDVLDLGTFRPGKPRPGESLALNKTAVIEGAT